MVMCLEKIEGASVDAGTLRLCKVLIGMVQIENEILG